MRYLLFVLLLCFGTTYAQAPASSHKTVPAPEWVEWKEIPKPREGRSGGDRVALLVDDQISLLGEQSHRFYRRVNRVVAASGIADAGDFTVEFDPAFEQVELHGAWVERAGKREDRLASARIDTLRREEGLESGMLDGVLTLHLVLDDIRVGDTVDVALSVRGDNPALAGRFSARYWFDVDVPTRLRQVRVLQPPQRRLEVQAQGSELDHAQAPGEGWIDHRWTLRDLLPRPEEDRVPDWHNAGPELEIADAAGWSDIVDWALPMYAAADDSGIAELAKELDLPRGAPSEAAILRAIRFVQDEIRYTGLELGAHAYQPYAPAEVARRRYGDCKDKAQMLVGLLRHIGVAASPALVDSDEGEQVARRLPSGQAFDHVIVRFEFEGREYWVDATADFQRGRLDRLVQADFGRALVLAPGESRLREIRIERPDEPSVDIDEVIDLRDDGGGLAEQGDYRIRTVYRAERADGVRRHFATSSVEEIGQGYVEAVAAYYPGVQQVEPPSLKDDAERNEVEVIERYRLPKIWGKRDDGKAGKQADFWLSEIDRAFSLPTAVDRRAPWHLGALQDIRQKLEVRLDSGWPKEDDRQTIEGAHVSYRGHVHNDGRLLRMEGRLRSKHVDVPAEEVAKLREDLSQLSESIGYQLTLGDGVVFGDGKEENLPVDLAQNVDARLAWLLLAIAALWAWVFWSGVSRSTAPALGMLFRPRASVRAGIERSALGTAVLVLAIGAALAALVDARVLAHLAQGRWSQATTAALPSYVAVFVIAGFYAAGFGWLARRFGGSGRTSDMFVAVAWAQIPLVASMVVYALIPLLYGAEAVDAPTAEQVVPLVLYFMLAGLPMLIWATVNWFAAYSEAQRLSIGHAVALTLIPLAILICLGIAAIVVVAILRAPG